MPMQLRVRARLTPARTIGGVAALTAIVAIAGCGGGGPKKVPLPSGSSSAAGRPASSPTSADQAVRQAYTAYWPDTNEALKAPPERVRPILARTSTGKFLNDSVRAVLLAQEQGRAPSGNVVPHITKVDVRDGKATLNDCQDASKAVLVDTRTGKVVPGTRGSSKRTLVARLELGGDGQWRLTGLLQYRRPCSVSS